MDAIVTNDIVSLLVGLPPPMNTPRVLSATPAPIESTLRQRSNEIAFPVDAMFTY